MQQDHLKSLTITIMKGDNYFCLQDLAIWQAKSIGAGDVNNKPLE